MRLPNGYGSVTRLSGKRRRPYIVRITTGWTDDGKQIMATLCYCRTKAEGLQALADYNKSPVDVSKAVMTFEDVYHAWSKAKFGSPEPERHYRGSYHYCRPLADRRFSDLKLADFQAVVNGCPYGFSPKRAIKSLLSQMTSYALSNDIVSRSYVDGIVLPKKNESGLHQPFTPQEIATLEQTDDPTARVALILIYTGMRPSELLKVKKTDVQLADRYLRAGLKTEAGKNRVVPIAEKIVSHVEFFLNQKPKSPYLISRPRADTEMDYSQFRVNYWTPLMRALKMEHHAHDGRHTCATLMDNADINPVVKKLILGHKSRDITERVYTHKTMEQLKEAINLI